MNELAELEIRIEATKRMGKAAAEQYIDGKITGGDLDKVIDVVSNTIDAVQNMLDSMDSMGGSGE